MLNCQQGGAFSKEERRQALMAALLLPLRAVEVPMKGKGKKTEPLTSHILMNSIKWRSKDAQAVQACHQQADGLLSASVQLQVCIPSLFPPKFQILPMH